MMGTKDWKRDIGFPIFSHLSSLLLLSFYCLVLTVYSSKAAKAEQNLKDFDYWASLCSTWENAANNQKYEEALKACDNALGIQPNQSKLWLARGNVLSAFNKFQEAIASYERVVTLQPKNSEGWTQKCLALSESGQYPQAIAACETALRIDDNWGRANAAVAWNYRGIAQSKFAQTEAARLSFDWATKLNPDYSLAWTNQCLSFYQAGNYQLALRACDRALEANQFWGHYSASIGWANRGKVTQAMGLYDESLQAYNRAIASNQNNPQLLTDYGIILHKLGKYEQAQSAFETALKLNPNYTLALVHQCANFNRIGMYKDAATACETALQKGDNSWGKEGVALGWNQYGNALTGLKKYEEALATLNRAIAIKPDYASAWTNRSVTLWHQGKNDEALASNQRALELDPNSTQAWYNQGRILTSLLDSEENIIAAYNRALKGDGYVGDNSMLAEIWVNQSAVLLRMKRYKDATVAADNALVFNSKYPEAWYNRAIGFMALREYQKALDSYGRAINIDGKNANFWAGKGIALRFLQRYPDSLVALKKALELNPNHPQALINQDIVMQKIQPPIP